MGNNISGSAAGWLDTTEERVSIKKADRPALDLSQEIDELKQIQRRITDKYKTNSTKNVYDAIILLEATSKSLLN